MIDYENMNKISHFLDEKIIPRTHWSNTSGWEMTSCIHESLVNKTKFLVEHVKFISLSCDEVTSFDQQS
jgi:hypothetical protein